MNYVPRFCEWELTLRCNFSCKHCYVRGGEARRQELSTEEALSVAEQLSEAGCEAVVLSGGEPLLREDWPQIAQALAQRGICVSLFSNGWLFDRQKAALAYTTGVRQVHLSLDGLERTHDRMRGRVGSWKRVQRAVEALQQAGVPVGVSTTITAWNEGELEDLYEVLTAWGVAFWQLALGSPNQGRKKRFWLQPEALFSLIPRLARLKERGKVALYLGDNLGYFGGYEEKIRTPTATNTVWSGCHAGCQNVAITSDGGVKGCLSMPEEGSGAIPGGERRSFVEGNLRQSSLWEIWSRPDAFSYNRSFVPEQLSGFCRSCEYALLCRGGCRWIASHYADGTMENHYCYHRQLSSALDEPAGQRKWSRLAATVALAMGMGLGGCNCGVEIVKPPQAASETAGELDKEGSTSPEHPAEAEKIIDRDAGEKKPDKCVPHQCCMMHAIHPPCDEPDAFKKYCCG